MVIQPPDGPLEDASDLAALWNDALLDFKDKTKLDLSKFQFKSMQEAIESTKSQSISFSAFRHDQGKVDKVRSAFGNNLKGKGIISSSTSPKNEGLTCCCIGIERIVSGAKMAAGKLWQPSRSTSEQN